MINMDERYLKLEETVRSYNPSANFEQIRAAYEYAAAAHQNQKRKDGSPYVSHPLAVAQIVAEELRLDSESIVAAILHDTIEDTAATYDEVSKLFSPTVADLVEGVSKLTRVQFTSKAQEQMENLRKMLLAMSKDIRVILVKVADRLHNMRTMEYQTPAKQKQKSFETMEIYAPIAHRLGMQRIKWELEDLSLKYLDPVGYAEILQNLEDKSAEHEAFMQRINAQISERVQAAGIKDALVYGRLKHPYSIYRKMYAQQKTMNEVFDLIAFRVIVDTVTDCYNVLASSMTSISRFWAGSRTISDRPSPICTRACTPRSWARAVRPLRCRSVPGRCMRSRNTALRRTGNISRTAAVPVMKPITNGFAACWKTRRVPTQRTSSTR